MPSATGQHERFAVPPPNRDPTAWTGDAIEEEMPKATNPQ